MIIDRASSGQDILIKPGRFIVVGMWNILK